MRAADCTEEQGDKICNYLSKKYEKEGTIFSYGKHCVCSHCPFGIDDGANYGQVYICMLPLLYRDLDPELEELIKGDSNANSL